MNGIYDYNNNLITKRIQSVVSYPEIVEIENQLLNGQIHIQTVGTGITICNVAANLSMSQKLLFETQKKTMAPIKVVFDGRQYTGLIRGIPVYDRIKKDHFTVTFTLIVQTEGTV